MDTVTASISTELFAEMLATLKEYVAAHDGLMHAEVRAGLAEYDRARARLSNARLVARMTIAKAEGRPAAAFSRDLCGNE